MKMEMERNYFNYVKYSDSECEKDPEKMQMRKLSETYFS
jgi:hypothetical protein